MVLSSYLYIIHLDKVSNLFNDILLLDLFIMNKALNIQFTKHHKLNHINFIYLQEDKKLLFLYKKKDQHFMISFFLIYQNQLEHILILKSPIIHLINQI